MARELIEFDREFAKMMSAVPKASSDADGDGVDPAEFQRYFVKHGRFTAGTAIRYYPSIISAEPTYQHLAKGLEIGMRFHSAPVIRLADAKPVQLGHTVKADGRWRLFAFAGEQDPADPSSRIQALCGFLADDPDSPVRQYTPQHADIDAVIDVRAVFQQGHRELAIGAMPSFLLPRKGRYRLRDYQKMFCADLRTCADPGVRSDDDMYDRRGIDRKGCIVVVRPDQHVAHVLPLDAYDELAGFFAGFMIPQE